MTGVSPNVELDSVRRKKNALYAVMVILCVMLAFFIIYYLGGTFSPLDIRFDLIMIAFVPITLISAVGAFVLNRREVLVAPAPMPRVSIARSYSSSSVGKFALAVVLFLILFVPYTLSFLEDNVASSHVERDVTGSDGTRFTTNDPLHFTNAVSITVEVETGSLHAALFTAESWDSGTGATPIFEQNVTGTEKIELVSDGQPLEPGEYVFELSTDSNGSMAKISIDREFSGQMVRALILFALAYGTICGISAGYFNSVKKASSGRSVKKQAVQAQPAFSEVRPGSVMPSADSHLQRIQYGPPQVRVTIQNVPQQHYGQPQAQAPSLANGQMHQEYPQYQPLAQRTAQQHALPLQTQVPSSTQPQVRQAQIPRVQHQPQATSQKAANVHKSEGVSVVTPEMQRARDEEQKRRKEAARLAELELKKKLDEEEKRRQETEARVRAAEEESRKLEKARIEAEADLRAKLEAAEKQRAAEETRRVELELKMKRSEEDKLRAELELQKRLLEEERRKLEDMKRLEAQKEQTVMNDVFLIHRDGRLICHNTRRLKPDVDNDILTGMFTAVTNFVRDTFKEETKGELNELKYGELNIFLEYGKHVYLAVVVQGMPPDDLRENMKEIIGIIERRFSPVLEEWDGTMSDIGDVKEIVKAIFTGSIARGIAEGPVVQPKARIPKQDLDFYAPKDVNVNNAAIEEPVAAGIEEPIAGGIEEPVPNVEAPIEEPVPFGNTQATLQAHAPAQVAQHVQTQVQPVQTVERKIKNVKCPKCSETFPADVTERPVKIECPSCGTSGVIK